MFRLTGIAVALAGATACGAEDLPAGGSGDDDTVAAGAEPVNGAVGKDSSTAPARSRAELRFFAWLEANARAEGSEVDGLYYAYYDAATDEPSFVSTMISAEVARARLASGELEAARRIVDGLVAWQHDGRGPFGERKAGAFPAQIERSEDGQWVVGYAYDSADNLTVIEALLDVYEATGDDTYLTSAIRSGAWVRDVMCHGERYGVWLEPLGAPMRYVTEAGDFDNRISVGRTLFWVPTLRRLARLSQDASFDAVANEAVAFLEQGQTGRGAFLDRYDPGYPPEPFHPRRFLPFGDDVVVADDSIRAAIALGFEDREGAVRRFERWLGHDRARIAGYLGLETGRGRFTERDEPYFDIVSTALFRRLALNRGESLPEASAFLAETQADNGGWFWGWSENRDTALTSLQSTLVGLWALFDLSPRT